MKPDDKMVDSLQVFPFLIHLVPLLKSEMPLYIAKTADVNEQMDPLEWWKLNASELPHWSSAARKVLVLQPFSAAAERVFLLLKASFSDQQESSLQDYKEASLICFNIVTIDILLFHYNNIVSCIIKTLPMYV